MLENSVSEKVEAKSRWTTRRKVLVATLILMGTGMVVVMPGLFWQLHEANKALRGFGDALTSKQYGLAYNFTSNEFRTSADFQTFQKVHDGLIVRMGDLKSLEITESQVKEHANGWYGTADARLTFSRGSLDFVFILKKENGSWKIYSYHEE
jgi:hypothetical protein